MAKINRFNPPPNWPLAPAGWTPPPEWTPDPAWGPVPAGWPLWVQERANPSAWSWAFTAAGIWLVVFLLLDVVIAVAAGGLSAESLGRALGAVLVTEALAAAITGLIAFSSSTRWGRWRYVWIVFGFSCALTVLSRVGSLAQG